MHTVLLSGTVAGRKNAAILELIESYLHALDRDITTEVVRIGEYQLEFSDGRPISQYNEDTQRLIATIMNADALIVATPTYQTSIPGALKNVFDLLPMRALYDKVAAMTVSANSPMYYLMAEQQLKPILTYLGAHVVPKYVYIEDKDFTHLTIHNEAIHERLKALSHDVYKQYVVLNMLTNTKI